MKGPHVIGLTGSIGMGKSTTAEMFRDEGIAVWSADEAVHRIYRTNAAAIEKIGDLCPDALVHDGIDRGALSRWIEDDHNNLARLEEIIHPLVAEDREYFLERSTDEIVVLDIPLLFEIGGTSEVDTIVVVSTDPDEQRRRVLERPNMTEAKFLLILSKQVPDQEKRRRADYVVETSSLANARSDVKMILKDLKDKMAHA